MGEGTESRRIVFRILFAVLAASGMEMDVLTLPSSWGTQPGESIVWGFGRATACRVDRLDYPLDPLQSPQSPAVPLDREPDDVDDEYCELASPSVRIVLARGLVTSGIELRSVHSDRHEPHPEELRTSSFSSPASALDRLYRRFCRVLC